jgi:hypothetical protein
VRFTATTPTNRWKDTVSAVDEKVWDMFAFNSTYRIHSVNDAETLDKTVVQFGRSGITPTYMRLPNDNQKLQLGIGQDLNFYHDGTDSWIENDTGVLNINEGATTVGRFDTSSTADDTRFLLYDVTAAALVRVSRGASDSGGTGFRLLRIPN